MSGSKFRVTLEHLKIAAKRTRKRQVGACHDESRRIMDAMEMSKTDDYRFPDYYKYIKEADDCFERARAERKRNKTSTLYYLSKYLDRQKFKKK